eukprot:7354743-Alexandrium_andersonii.AAC.1
MAPTTSGPSRMSDRRQRLCFPPLEEAGLLELRSDGLELLRKTGAVPEPLRGVILAAQALLGARVLERGDQVAGEDLPPVVGDDNDR